MCKCLAVVAMLCFFSRTGRHCSNWTTPSCMWRKGGGTLITYTQFSNAITSPGRALSMPGKRSELNLVVAALIQCVDSLGYLGIRLSTDGELAFRVMAARMPRHRPRTTLELAYRQSGRSRGGGVGRSQKRSGHELRHACLVVSHCVAVDVETRSVESTSVWGPFMCQYLT